MYNFKPGAIGRPRKQQKTVYVKNEIKRISEKYLQEIEQDLDKMTPVQRWRIIINLMRFAIPTATKNDAIKSIGNFDSIAIEWEEKESELEMNED